MPSLNEAITQRRLKQVNFLVNAGVNLNSRNSNGETPLLQLCDFEPEEKAVNLAKLFITKGAKVDIGDKKRRNALMRAILNEKEKLVSLFLEEILDFNLNAKDCDGNTALALAARVGNDKIVREIVTSLRKFGLTVDVRNEDGLTPLMMAAKNGNLSSVQVILKEGKASRFIRDDIKWQTALEWEKFGAQTTSKLDKSILNRVSSSSARSSSSKASQKKEIGQLFRIYEGQLSPTYRKGFDSSKCTNLYENLGFERSANNNENMGDSEERVCGESKARFLFAKSTAVIKFKRNGGLLNARKLIKKDSSSSSCLDEKNTENTEQIELKQRTTRPVLRRPIRCRSEIFYSKMKSEKVENEREKTFHFSTTNGLPKILLEKPVITTSKDLKAFEENEN